MSKIIPNTFQTPNAHVDDAMYLLTPEEYKVLNFAVRHIYGWQLHVRAISLTMFVNGYPNKKSGGRFNGTGLSRGAVIKCLTELSKYKLLVPEGKPDAKGQAWTIGEDPDWQGLEARSADTLVIRRARTAAAREAGQSDRLVSGTNQQRSVGLTTTGQSDRLNQNQYKNQDKESVAASIEDRTQASETSSVEASENDATQELPLQGLAKPRKRSALQSARDEAATIAMNALAAAMGVTLAKSDEKRYSQIAQTLVSSTITYTEFELYVKRLQKKAAGEGNWNVTVESLLKNGRPSEYVTAREAYRKAQVDGTAKGPWTEQATQTGSDPSRRRYKADEDPAYQPVGGSQ
jgi:hypothetical protein